MPPVFDRSDQIVSLFRLATTGLCSAIKVYCIAIAISEEDFEDCGTVRTFPSSTEDLPFFMIILRNVVCLRSFSDVATGLINAVWRSFLSMGFV